MFTHATANPQAQAQPQKQLLGNNAVVFGTPEMIFSGSSRSSNTTSP
jgi:hypothetical protein